MPIPAAVQARLDQKARLGATTGPKPKRGDDIYTGTATDYPRDWAEFVGQDEAKEQLRASILSSRARGTRLDHTLLGSGLHGVGKTTLAYLIAYQMGVGITPISGPVTVDEARTLLLNMEDGDILFWDEFHSAVTGSKGRANWTLPFLTDGVLLTAQGAEKVPNVTIIAATTDAGRLPQTILSRFMVVPRLTAYSEPEAVCIVDKLSERMGVPVQDDELLPIAKAASHNPRDMRKILTAVRDVAYTPSGYTFDKALRWAGFSHDGLDQVARDMMMLLLDAKDCTMGLDTLSAHLNEPGPLRHSEQLLLQKGYLTIVGRGRKLTDEGILRALGLVEEGL